MKRKQIESTHIGEYYWNYINLIPAETDLIMALDENTKAMIHFFKKIPLEKWNHRYAPEKWSILEMVQHIIDTERIFQYRALAIARNEKTALPGYDHDDYVKFSLNDREPESLIEEFEAVRRSGVLLFKSFSEEMLFRLGSMNGLPATPGAIGFILPGHCLHHKKIITERYL